jgi:NitT/TauT family transport system substrate-binding protein
MINKSPPINVVGGTDMERKVLVALAIAIAVIVVAGAYAATVLLRESKGGDVYYLRIAPANMAASLASGSVDAYIAWEPFVSEAIVGGTGEVLMWSDEVMPNHPCCVVAISNSFIEGADGEELAKRFLKAHIEATDWMIEALEDPQGSNYTLLITLASEFTARNASVVQEALRHLEFRYQVDSVFTSALEEFVDLYVQTNQTTEQEIADRGYSSVADLVDKYVDESYLEAAASIQPSATILNPSSPVRLGYLLGDLHQLAQFVAADDRVLGGSTSLFELYGVNVQPAAGAPYANGGIVMDNFAAGNVDIGYLGAPPALIKHIKGGVDVVIVSQANIEGSGLVVKVGSDIRDLEDLVNRTVATPGETSIQHLLLKIALDREGIALVLRT